MTSLILCGVAFLVGAVAGRRSLATGLGAVLGVGYLYGILRANAAEAPAHFIFDAAVLGLYLTQLPLPVRSADRQRTRALLGWVSVLILWPAVLFLVPFQHPLVQLVGLRGNVFLLPFLLLGARLTREAAYSLALWVAALNLVAFGFAAAEFSLGVERFFPRNAMTRLVYMSLTSDLKSYRIPACFANSHAYGGTMAATLPWLVGAWLDRRGKSWHNYLIIAALVAAVLGVFLSASRSAAAVMLLLLGGLLFTGRLGSKAWLGLLVILPVVGYLVNSEKRLQRFTELQDADSVASRVGGTISVTVLEAMIDHPLGNGLGGGGTSLPYFLQGYVPQIVVFENEYARIALEQGLPGLLLWVGFILWVLTRKTIRLTQPWGAARWLLRLSSWIAFGSGLIGTGLFTSIPGTALWLTGTGWIVVTQPVEPARGGARLPARTA